MEEVQVGDLVWASDPTTGEQGWQPVVRLFEHDDQLILELVLPRQWRRLAKPLGGVITVRN